MGFSQNFTNIDAEMVKIADLMAKLEKIPAENGERCKKCPAWDGSSTCERLGGYHSDSSCAIQLGDLLFRRMSAGEIRAYRESFQKLLGEIGGEGNKTDGKAVPSPEKTA